MKYTSIIGLLLTVIGLILYILQEPDYTYKEFYIAAFLFLGIGLFFGGIMGFLQKKRNKIIQPKVEPKKQDSFTKTDTVKDNSGL